MPACPACGKPLPDGSTVQCACGQWSRIEELPERRCRHCAGTVPVTGVAARCTACGRLQASGSSTLRVMADCPRCRRRIDVDPDGDAADCPHCGQKFHLQDTL